MSEGTADRSRKSLPGEVMFAVPEIADNCNVVANLIRPGDGREDCCRHWRSIDM